MLVFGIALIFLLPIFAIIGIFIKLDSKGSVFFVQERVGKDGKVFRAYKLGTMVNNAEKLGKGLRKDDPKITHIGRIVR